MRVCILEGTYVLLQLEDRRVIAEEGVFVAESAVVIGSVLLKAHASVWFNAVIRGDGEPIKLIVDMDAADDVVSVFIHDSDRRLLLVSTDGRGFVVAEASVAANTRKGRQVMNPSGGAELLRCSANTSGIVTQAAGWPT